MKPVSVFVILVLTLYSVASLAEPNVGAKVSVDADSKLAAPDGDTLIPILLKDFTSVLAARFVVGYAGTLGDVSFEPADYLHVPIMLPIRVDRANKTVDISITATDRVATRNKDGAIGFLRIAPGSDITSYEIKRAEFIDENYRTDVLVDNTVEQKNPNLHETSEATRKEIARTQLFQNVPNPSNPTTTISFDLRKKSPVRLEIYSVTGRHIATLVNTTLDTNHYEIEWGGHDDRGVAVSSGVYFYRFQAGSHIETKKLIILK